tara:strand:+ start:667 stop:1029 length:363 start_codon:yes stop_codon:yes gene_type:complete
MEKLPNDILLIIGFKSDFNSILNFSIINKNNFKLFDDLFFKELSEVYYSSEFWKKANKRPLYNSKPLNNFKLELIRIENFQKHLDSLNVNRWTKKDFYNYWKYRDKYLNIEDLYSVLNVL